MSIEINGFGKVLVIGLTIYLIGRYAGKVSADKQYYQEYRMDHM